MKRALSFVATLSLFLGFAPVENDEYFADGFHSLRPSRWSVLLNGWSMVQERRHEVPEVRVENRPYLLARQGFPRGGVFAFEWAWEDQGAGPQSADELTIVLRSTGTVENEYPYSIQDGIRVAIHAGTGKVRIESVIEGVATLLGKEASIPAVEPVDWHSVVITDSSKEIDVRFNGRSILRREYDRSLYSGTLFGITNGASGGVDDTRRASYIRRFSSNPVSQ